jgi:hypothetical protein
LEEAAQAAADEAFRYRERRRAEKAKRIAAEEERKAKKEKKAEERKAQEVALIAERQAAILVNGNDTEIAVLSKNSESPEMAAELSMPQVNGKVDKTRKRKKSLKE